MLSVSSRRINHENAPVRSTAQRRLILVDLIARERGPRQWAGLYRWQLRSLTITQFQEPLRSTRPTQKKSLSNYIEQVSTNEPAFLFSEQIPYTAEGPNQSYIVPNDAARARRNVGQEGRSGETEPETTGQSILRYTAYLGRIKNHSLFGSMSWKITEETLWHYQNYTIKINL